MQTSNSSSRLPRILWIAFLIWSAIGGVVMLLGLRIDEIIDAAAKPGLFCFLDTFDRHADAVWMFLAAASLFTILARDWGSRATWLHLAIIGVVTGLIEWIGVKTGLPFGDYHYTDRYGFRLFGVLPLAIPFAWFVVVGGGLGVVQAFLPQAGRWSQAGIVAILAVLTDLNLEPIAWKLRRYWEWYPGVADPPALPPIQNYLSWGGIAFVLAMLCSLLPVAAQVRSQRPLLVLVVLNAVLLLGHVGMR